MTPLTQAITGALFEFVWQGSIVALALSVILLALRRSRPEARYAAACAALLVLAVLPVVTAWRLYPAMLSATRTVPVSDLSIAMETLSVTGFIAEPLTRDSLDKWVFPAWLLGVSLFALRFVWSAGQLALLRRNGRPADEETVRFITRVAGQMNVRRFQVLFSSLTDVPSVIGWIRPVILLPAATLAGLTPRQLEAVIAHELAHIRRHDYAINILQMLIETLLFYHPAVWWTSTRIRVERELCCDDAAVRTCGDHLGYARALAAIEKMRVPKPGFAVGSGDGPLLFRVKRLVSPDVHHAVPSRFAGALVLVMIGIFLFALNTNGLRAQEEHASALATVINAPPAGSIPPVVSAALMNTPAPAVSPQAAATPAAPTPQTTARQERAPVAYLLHLDGRSFSNQVSPEQANTLRGTFAGNFLWFRLAGTAYLTQDKAVLDRMASLYAAAGNTPLPQSGRELAAYLNQLAERQAQSDSRYDELARVQLELARAEELSQRGLISDIERDRLRNRYEAISAEITALQGRFLESTTRIEEALRQRERAAGIEQSPGINAEITEQEIASLQSKMMAVRTQMEQLQAELRQKQSEQIRLQEAMRSMMLVNQLSRAKEQKEGTAEILRDAVESGVAKPVR